MKGRPKIRRASGALDQLIDHMSDTHLQCRDFGHSWRPYTAMWDPKERCYNTQLRCSRCRTIRHRIITSTGEQVESRYDYATGYLVNGLGRLSPDDRNHLRLTSVLRVLVEDTAEEEA